MGKKEIEKKNAPRLVRLILVKCMNSLRLVFSAPTRNKWQLYHFSLSLSLGSSRFFASPIFSLFFFVMRFSKSFFCFLFFFSELISTIYSFFLLHLRTRPPHPYLRVSPSSPLLPRPLRLPPLRPLPPCALIGLQYAFPSPSPSQDADS